MVIYGLFFFKILQFYWKYNDLIIHYKNIDHVYYYYITNTFNDGK